MIFFWQNPKVVAMINANLQSTATGIEIINVLEYLWQNLENMANLLKTFKIVQKGLRNLQTIGTTPGYSA